MYTTKEKLNSVGVVAGLFLASIPFYYFIRMFSSMSTFKKAAKLRTLALITTIITLVTPIFLVFSWIIYLIVIATSFYGFGIGGVFLLIFSILLVIALIALNIVTGISTENFLKTEESNHLSHAERFELAKCAGVCLVNIPFFIIIKTIIKFKVIKSVQNRGAALGLIITYFSVYGGYILFSFISSFISSFTLTSPNLGVQFFESTLSFAVLIITIITAIFITNLFDNIVLEDDSVENQQFSTFNNF